jgi:hypothetical protein
MIYRTDTFDGTMTMDMTMGGRSMTMLSKMTGSGLETASSSRDQGARLQLAAWM